jgi:hypothetical protein
MLRQLGLMIAAGQEDLADLEGESEADSVGAIDLLDAAAEDAPDSGGNDGAVQEADDAAAPSPAPAEPDLGSRRTGQRGRARR